MSYTFSDQQGKLSSLLGDPNTSTDDQFPLATRKKELNRGELQFAKDAKNLREYATGTVANKELSVPSDWLETWMLTVADIVITNDREISLADWERYYNYGGESPYYYFWEFSGTRKIKFLASTAVNGKTYQLFYFKRPTTELSQDTETSLHPEEYREASVYFAASELMKQIGKMELANQYRQMYEFLVEQAKREIERTYIKKEYARPDFGPLVGDDLSTDVQGRSYPY